MSSVAASRAAPPKAGFRLPRWLTAEHPFPWLLPTTALILACGIYPLFYSVWLSFQERSRVTQIG
ncbi:MAG: sugar ABC transporter permease, partial [Geminicoccaceae bacterium]